MGDEDEKKETETCGLVAGQSLGLSNPFSLDSVMTTAPLNRPDPANGIFFVLPTPATPAKPVLPVRPLFPEKLEVSGAGFPGTAGTYALVDADSESPVWRRKSND